MQWVKTDFTVIRRNAYLLLRGFVAACHNHGKVPFADCLKQLIFAHNGRLALRRSHPAKLDLGRPDTSGTAYFKHSSSLIATKLIHILTQSSEHSKS